MRTLGVAGGVVLVCAVVGVAVHRHPSATSRTAGTTPHQVVATVGSLGDGENLGPDGNGVNAASLSSYSRNDIVGEWNGQAPYTNGPVTLFFREDGTYSMFYCGEDTATWRLEGNRVLMTHKVTEASMVNGKMVVTSKNETVPAEMQSKTTMTFNGVVLHKKVS